MSKEFQIRDGNLIASFDLENEDGDIDFCKLLKVSHGVADEIGMFVDYVATNKIIKDQSKQIADLETKLADLQQEQIAEMKEHQEAMKLADKTIKATEEQNKRVLEKLELIVRANQELEQKLAESKNSLKRTIDHYEKYCSEINHQNVMLYASACNAQQASRDKISFAVEQLETVKEKAIKPKDYGWCDKYKDCCDIVMDIDNQIKQLKEMK